MKNNQTIGFILIALLLIGYGWYMQPSQEEIAEYQRQDSINAAMQAQAAEAQMKAAAEKRRMAEEAAQGDTTALFYSALNGVEKQITLKSNKLNVNISTKGGTISEAKILGFNDLKKNAEGNPDRHGDCDKDVTLFSGDEQSLALLMAAKELNINTADLYFTPSNVTDSTVTMTAYAKGLTSPTSPQEGLESPMRGDLEGSPRVVIDYCLHHDYILSMSLRVVGLSGIFPPATKELDIQWKELARQHEAGFTFENRYSSLTYKETDGGTDYLNETAEKKDEKIEEALDWIAFKNQFFSAVIIPEAGIAANSSLTSIPQQKNSGYIKQYSADMKTAFDPTGAQPTNIDFIFTPNDFRLLQDIEEDFVASKANNSKLKTQNSKLKDYDLPQLVYLGWPLFRIINRWFTIYVFDGLRYLGFGMGVILILITLLLKLITFPMVKKSYMSSAKMRVLKPKLDAATSQYNKPEDAMQKQQAMMQMYSQYGVSPLGGCLPMLIQFPIWIAMFNFVPNAIQLRGQSFLWIDDLSTFDPIIEWNTDLWMIGDHLSLTCILFCVSNVLYSWMTMRQQRDQMVGQQAEQMKMMQWMIFLMPVMFFFMFNDYSSGLNFYYFISLFFSAAIMWVLRKTTDDAKLLAKLEANYKKNQSMPQKQSGFAARLAKMQQEQQEMMKRRQQMQRK